MFDVDFVLDSDTKIKFIPSIFKLLLLFKNKLKVSLETKPHFIFSWPSKKARG